MKALLVGGPSDGAEIEVERVLAMPLLKMPDPIVESEALSARALRVSTYCRDRLPNLDPVELTYRYVSTETVALAP